MKFIVEMPDRIFEYISNVGGKVNRKKLKRDLDISEQQARYYLKVYKDKIEETIGNSLNRKIEEVNRDYGEEKGTITTKSWKIRTVEDALEKAEVDMNMWEVDRHLINSYEVTMGNKKTGTGNPETYTNWQVKIWLRRKIQDVEYDAIKELIKEIPKLKVPKLIRKIPKTEYALEVAQYDAHIGKLAWGKETLTGNQDTKLAARWYTDATAQNLNYSAGFNISKIYYILGQDLLHIENYQAETPMAKNRLESDVRLPKILAAAKASVLKSIYMCKEVAPVEIIWIPGNHDMAGSLMLSEIVKEHFRDDKWITVDNGPSWYKAILWGNLLIGFIHDGDKRQHKVVNMLPQLWPELWGKSKYREWHCGHLHAKQSVKYYPIETVGGTLVRRLPALSKNDSWHSQNYFNDALPASDSFILSKENGVIGTFTSFVEPS